MNNPEIEVNIDAEILDIHSFQWKSSQLKSYAIINLRIYKALKEFCILSGKPCDFSPENMINQFKELDNTSI